MWRFRKQWALVAILAGIVTLGLAPPGQAAFRLRLEDGLPGGANSGVVITDQGPGDISPSLGAITFSGVIDPNFQVNVTTGTSQPLLGNHNQIDLNSVNVASLGAGTITITLEDMGFSNPSGGSAAMVTTIGGTLQDGATGTITAQTWINTGNLVPAMGPDAFPTGPLAALGGIPGGSVKGFTPTAFSSGNGAFSATSLVNTGAISGPYSLFTEVTIAFSGAGSVSFNENIQVAAPAPAGLVLAFSGLPLLGFGYLRRRFKSAVA